jgi:hypothetical protein
VEQYGRARQATDENIIQGMRFASWITNVTYTLRICNTYCFSTTKMVTRTHLNVISTLPYLFQITKAVPWFRRLVAGLSARLLQCKTNSINVEFVVGRQAVNRVFSLVFQFSLVSIIPPMPYTRFLLQNYS